MTAHLVGVLVAMVQVGVGTFFASCRDRPRRGPLDTAAHGQLLDKFGWHAYPTAVALAVAGLLTFRLNR